MSVMKRNRQIEARFNWQNRTIVMLAIVAGISVTGNVVQALHRPQPVYFAQDIQTGTLTQLSPLSQPVESNGIVIQHVADAVGRMFTLDFLNFKSQMTLAAPYFTPNGWGRWKDAFAVSGNVGAMEKQRLILSGVVTRPPVVVKEGELPGLGIYAWDLEVPYTVRYLGPDVDRSVNFIAQVKVVRVPARENPKGIAIASFIVRQGAGGG